MQSLTSFKAYKLKINTSNLILTFGDKTLLENDPRYVALLILIENSRTRVPLDTILDQFAPRLDMLSKLDRSLTNAIVYGTLRWRESLDWIVQPFSNRRIETLKIEVAYILRIAMFQIVFMDKIPVSAAVNSAVNLAKKISHQGVAGFVNAVLRKASSHCEEILHSKENSDFKDITSLKDIVLPDSEAEPELYISVTKSMPLWLVRRWVARFGFDKTLKLCEKINTIPPITVRANRLKIDREELISVCSSYVEQIAPTDNSPDGLYFTKPLVPIHESEAFKKGLFQVQDEAAQLVTIMLNPLPGETILDACAGLGGKTGHIAQLMKNEGSIIACDTDIKKLESLKKEMKRLGIDVVQTICKDILKADLSDFGTQFDKVLVDAPCSGMGVLRRNPDAKWKRTKKDLARLAIRQERMLLSVANLVKAGGSLLYAVCSCETRENEAVIEGFLKQRPDFLIKKELRTYPDNSDMDGFFATLMERKVN